MQNICLAALSYGLGTCIHDQGVLYPEVLRRHAGIPGSKRIIIAISIGYPDEDNIVNTIASTGNHGGLTPLDRISREDRDGVAHLPGINSCWGGRTQPDRGNFYQVSVADTPPHDLAGVCHHQKCLGIDLPERPFIRV
jgi:hypothetical protein